MFMRAFLFSAVIVAFAAPTAEAGVLDAVVPVYDASDGVTAGQGAHGGFFRFGPKAAKLYRGLAGQKVTVGCGHPIKDDGSTGYVSSGSTDGTDMSWAVRAGMAWTDIRMPRKRGRVDVPVMSAADVCFISAKELTDDVCMPAVIDDERCVNVVVAATAQGLVDIDERLRAVEISAEFGYPLAEVQEQYGANLVVLATPDASPPLGRVGIFSDAQTTVFAALLRDGTRRYMRQDGDVFSTNLPALAGGGLIRSLF